MRCRDLIILSAFVFTPPLNAEPVQSHDSPFAWQSFFSERESGGGENLRELVIQTTQDSEGGISSGGGMGVIRTGESNLEILDFYLLDANFRSRRLIPGVPNLSFPQSEFSAFVGYQKLTSQQIASTQEARFLRQRLEVWKENAPILVEFLTEQLDRISVSLTRVPFESLSCEEDHKPSPALDQNHLLYTASVYTPLFGAIFQEEILARAGLESRAALLLHEVFRRVQTQWEIPISDIDLMYLTATLILGTPNSHLSLDDAPGLASYIGIRKSLAFGSPEIAKICESASRLEFMPTLNSFCEGRPVEFTPELPRELWSFRPHEVLGVDDRSHEDKLRDALADRINEMYYRALYDYRRQPQNSRAQIQTLEIVARIDKVKLESALNGLNETSAQLRDLGTDLQLGLLIGLSENVLESYLQGELPFGPGERQQIQTAACSMRGLVHLSLQQAYCSQRESRLTSEEINRTLNNCH